MDRRRLIGQAVGVTAAATSTPATARGAGAQRPPMKLKLGHQHQHSPAWLTLLSSLGVNHICSGLPSRVPDENWTPAGLKRLKSQVESYGIQLDMVPLPLSSSYITRSENPHILLGKDPQRDAEISTLCDMIRAAGEAGIPAVKYNLTLLGVVRTERTPGRGRSTYSTFVYDKAVQDPPLTEAGRVDERLMWERITYFLERVVPAAEKARVRIACHPNDPGMPIGKGFRGVECVLGTVEGLKRFVSTCESPYHGLNFCQGTVCEMLKTPNSEIVDIIRYFGERKKIFNVHLRNIRGGFLNFQETFPDDGDVDLKKCLRAYQECGFDGMIMPDHVPHVDGDAGGMQAFSFAFGYIRAMLQDLEREASRLA